MEKVSISAAPQVGEQMKLPWGGNDIIRQLLKAALLGLIFIAIFAVAYSASDFLKIISTAFLLAGATFISGTLLGFLFGIPRTDPQEKEGNNANNNDDAAAKANQSSFKPNTNLEQISDWLTKILVGVGLTQLHQITQWLRGVVNYFKPYIGDNPAIVTAIIIYYLVVGFLLGFLWSRLYMAGAIRRAEADALRNEIVKAVEDRAGRKEQVDAAALSLVHQLLDAGTVNLTQENINKIIEQASPVLKVSIFNQARAFRQEHWVEEKEKLSRVIPIFHALIACDTEQEYHRNYGQLAYALKDKPDPDYAGAEAALTKAMEIRDKTGKQGKWLLYEFNRAYCRIMINRAQGKEVYPVDAIYEDIQKAGQTRPMKDLLLREPVIVDWLKENNFEKK